MKTPKTSNFLPMSAFPTSSSSNYLSITRAGYLHLPKGFLEQHHFDRFSHLDLLWDPDQQRLAMVPLREKSHPRVWKLSRYPLGGAHITIRGFCKHFQIDLARVAGR